MYKKLLLALTLVSGSAFAGDKIELGYRYDDVRNSSADSRNVAIGYSTPINSNFTFGLGANLAERTTDNRLTNRVNASVTGSYDMFYLSAKVGEKFVSGNDSTSFWVLEPGIKFAVTDRLDAKIGYSYREAFSKTVDDDQTGVKTSLNYVLTKDLGVSVKYNLLEDSQGVKQDQYGISLVKKF
jgi:outer membrane usher protein FimD/PapC